MVELDALRQLRHDIRSTFGSLVMCLGVAELDIPDDEQLPFLGEVINAADALTEKVSQMERLLSSSQTSN
ncbi:MAG TPA: hypothetical protein VLJ39_22985 [Tepidisphaeraceae bacterium]|nr:hypothetical protein [Tepidisphaeraceae bacterium]